MPRKTHRKLTLHEKIEELEKLMAHSLSDLSMAVSDLSSKIDNVGSVLADLKGQLATALSQIGQLTPEMQGTIDSTFDAVTAASAKLDDAMKPSSEPAPAPVEPSA